MATFISVHLDGERPKETVPIALYAAHRKTHASQMLQESGVHGSERGRA